ncbi:hypothetical protein [Streptomyces monashensis]|uniref:hypothetical protein n=1 Tax=Streptomyces monashensis TaxID=1678012 RepID=UPI0015A668FC|nr:hypothetical protein [Streptomyces monashensis]
MHQNEPDVTTVDTSQFDLDIRTEVYPKIDEAAAQKTPGITGPCSPTVFGC